MSAPPPSTGPLATPLKRRPRILMYVQDSWGLGHIQRAAKLARVMQDSVDFLILCGHREAGWIVPERCEYVRIPSLNTPLSKGSQGVFWGRRSFLELSGEEATQFRKVLISGTISTFCPDVIIVENRPLGMMDELDGILDQCDAAKVFLTRGIMTHPDYVRADFLNPQQEQALKSNLFRKIIVAADRRVWDLSREYELGSEISNKLEYVGYMSEPIQDAQIQAARFERGLSNQDRWIVCSAGGGALGEPLVQSLLGTVDRLSNVTIDVVQGPHSTLEWPLRLTDIAKKSDIRLHRECRILPLLHAAADLVICPAGYNSLTEVMEGGAPIITTSVQPDADGEQFILASQLSQHYPITVIREFSELAQAISDVLAGAQRKLPIRQSGTLDFDGLSRARQVIFSMATAIRDGGRDPVKQ